MSNNNITLKIILIILLLGCLFNMPYGYYQLTRFAGMVIFAILSYNAYKIKERFFFVMYLSSSILINPIVKIYLGREIWNIVDLIWAIILFTTIIIEIKKTKRG